MIQVLDDVISSRYSRFIFDQIVKLPWTFVPDLSYSTIQDTDNCGFSYNFFLAGRLNNQGTTIDTPEYNYLKPLFFQAFDRFGIDVELENIVRCRARLTIQKSTNIIESRHVDYKFDHLVLLYYINTTDGDTVLFDNNNQILERISPRRGRCVLFDGNIAHASSSSTLSPRLVLNTNIIL